ncbi:phage holin family protein [Rubritalea spongiae]|uniref:Phage holin family protein n=1 Tax=Rubritalea spongiae TaxID=430797 RepID=A0ABW5E0G0_9BACT
MTDPGSQERDISMKDTINYIKDEGGAYFKTKVELASIEAKEAAEITAKKAKFGGILVFFALFSYILLLVSLIGAFTKLLEGKVHTVEQYIGTWPIVTFGFLILHLLVVFIFLDKLKNVEKVTLFKHTLAELEKDKQWLQQIKSSNKS